MRRLALPALAALLLSSVSAAEEAASPTVEETITAGQLGPTRELNGDEFSEACSARDRADRMQADFRARFRNAQRELNSAAARRGQRLDREPIPEGFESDSAAVVQAYQDAIDRYPHTEIAAYCAIRLAGHYNLLRKTDEAIVLTAKTACQFAGTSEGVEALFETGLAHLQGRHDPAEALKWFARIPRPTGLPAGRGAMSRDAMRYFSAQQQAIKCELQLGLEDQAKKRRDETKQLFPEQAAELDRFYESQPKSQSTAAEPDDPKPGAEYGEAIDRFNNLSQDPSSTSSGSAP